MKGTTVTPKQALKGLALFLSLCLALGLTAGFSPCPAQAAETTTKAAPAKDEPAPDPAKLKQAERYWQAAGMDAQIKDSLKRLVGAVPEDRRAELGQAVKLVLKKGQLKHKVLALMSQTFTLPELTVLADFYTSPEGRSVMTKMRPFMEKFSQTVMDSVRQARAEMPPDKVNVVVPPKAGDQKPAAGAKQ